MASSPTILVFTWDTDGINICGSTESNKDKFTMKKSTCVVPNFMDEFVQEYVARKKPEIIVFTTQGEPSKNSEFFKFVSHVMKTNDYLQISFEKMSNISEYQSGSRQKRVPSSKTGAIRQAIFVEKKYNEGKNIAHVWQKKITNIFDIHGLTNKNVTGTKTIKCRDGTRNSGAIATYVDLVGHGTIAFISVHLPGGKIQKDVQNNFLIDNYELYRNSMVAANRVCMLKIINDLVLNVKDKLNIKHFLIAGDLNYEISPINKISAYQYFASSTDNGTQKLAVLYEHDELNREQFIDPTLYMLKEGVQDAGPRFFPNWKMQSIDQNVPGSENRPHDCLNSNTSNMIQCYNNKTKEMGWKDRILYASSVRNRDEVLVCDKYEIFDYKNIVYSDHTAIIGQYSILSTKLDTGLSNELTSYLRINENVTEENLVELIKQGKFINKQQPAKEELKLKREEANQRKLIQLDRAKDDKVRQEVERVQKAIEKRKAELTKQKEEIEKILNKAQEGKKELEKLDRQLEATKQELAQIENPGFFSNLTSAFDAVRGY